MAILTSTIAPAAQRFWDTSSSANLQAGSGLWDTGTTALWSTATGGTALVTWADNDAAVFRTGGTNTVDLGGGIILAESLTNSVGSTTGGTVTTLNNGTLQLTSNTGIINNQASSTSSLTLNNVRLASSAVGFFVGAGTTVTVNGAIDETGGARGLTKTEAGTLNLNGANTYTGGTTINGGVLRFGAASAVPTSGSIVINSLGTLSASGPAGFANVTEWLGSGKITAASSGALAINANSAETIDFSVAHGGVNYNDLYLGATGAFTYSGAITPGSNGYLLGGSSTLTVSSALNVATKLTVGATGVLILSNANTYTGVTTVGATSTLRLTNADALGSTAAGTVVASGGTLQLVGGHTFAAETVTISGTGAGSTGALNNTTGNNTWTGNVVLGANAARIGTSADTLTVTGVVSDGTGAPLDLAIRNAANIPGAVILSGANTYRGNTQIVLGTLRLGADNTLPVTNVILGNAAGQGSALFDLNGRTQNLTGVTNLAATNITTRVANTAAAAGALQLHVSSASSNLGNGSILPVVFGDAGQNNFSVTKAGPATYTLLGAHTYTGGTTVNGGTLLEDYNYAVASSGLNAALIDNLDGTAALTLGGGAFQIRGRATSTATSLTNASWANGGRTITVASTAGLTAGQVISGVAGIPAGAYVAHVASGTQFILSVPTTAAGSAATLAAAASSATTSQTFAGLTLNPGASAVDVNFNNGLGTTLDLRGASGLGVITRSAGAAIDFRASGGGLGTTAFIRTHQGNDATGIIGGYATVGGADWAANDGADNIVAYTGYTDVEGLGGTIPDNAQANIRLTAAGVSGEVALAAGNTTINTLVQNSTTAATIDVTGKSLRVGAIGGILTGAGRGALRIGGGVDQGTLTAGGAPDTAGELIFHNFAAAGAASAITAHTTIIDNGSGSVSLLKTGPGDLVLSSAFNSYSGKTILAGGATTIFGDGSFGPAPLSAVADQLSLHGGTVRLAASFDLDPNRGIALLGGGGTFDTGGFNSTYTGTISGLGQFTKTGAGTLTLSGPHTYTGLTSVTGGVLLMTHPSVLGTSTAGTNVSGGGTLALEGDIAVSGETLTISGEGVSNLGTLRSNSGNNTWSGAIFANAGNSHTRIAALAGSLTLTSDITTSGFNSLVLQGDGAINVNGSITGSAGVIRSATGAGVVTLGGTNTYTGSTLVSNGTLIVNGSIAGTSGMSVAAIGTLGGNGTIRTASPGSNATGVINITSGGTVAPGNGPGGIGTLTIDSGGSSAASNFSLSSGAKFTMELGVGFQSDRILLANGTANDISFGGNTINFSDLTGGALTYGNYTLFSANVANAYSGLVVDGSGVITSGLAIGTGLEAYAGSSLQVLGNDIVLAVVPEPSTAVLLSAAAAVLGWRRARRRA